MCVLQTDKPTHKLFSMEQQEITEKILKKIHSTKLNKYYSFEEYPLWSKNNNDVLKVQGEMIEIISIFS